MMKQMTIDLQHFMSGEGHLTIEIFEWKDPESQKILKIPVKIKTGNEEIDMKVIIGHLNSGIRKVVSRDVRSKVEAKLKELQDALASKDNINKELLAKIKEYEDSKLLTRKQMEKNNHQLLLKEKEANASFQMFQEIKIEKDICSALYNLNIKNIEETFLLIKEKGTALLKEENGKYRTVICFQINGTEKEFSVKEAVGFFSLNSMGLEHLGGMSLKKSSP